MQCYFVRHGETDFNKSGRIMGQLDEPLDQEGIEQSRQLAEKIDSDFDLIFCSPMTRTKQTAEVINQKLKIPIEYRDEIRERNFGSLAGESLAEMDQDTKQEIKQRDFDLTYDYRPYGGESVEDVKARLQSFIASLKGRPEKKALVVTHTGIIRLMYPTYLGVPYPAIDNDSVHIFEV
jgi:broad specificity phosphatase PhoE